MKLGGVGLVVIAVILVATAPGDARPHHGGQGGGHDHGGGHHDGHRGFHRDHHGHVIIGGPFFFGPVYPYYDAPYYAYAPPPVVVQTPPVYVQPPPQSYWYFCPSFGAYYPTVRSCPEPWLPVPATP
jgi:hypothetical protein